MKAHPLSLIDDNEDNSSQTYISTTKAKKSLKEDDVSTENTLKINKKYIFQEKPINLNNRKIKQYYCRIFQDCWAEPAEKSGFFSR